MSIVSVPECTGPGSTGQAQVVALPIDEVILLEDRAQVVRRGTVALPAGPSSFRVAGVSPVLADRTVAVSLVEPAAGTTVIDTWVDRHLRPVEEQQATAAGAHRDLLHDQELALATLQRRQQLLQQQLALAAETYARTLEDIATDVAWGREEPVEWRGWLAALQERELDLRRQLLAVTTEAGQLQELINDLRSRVRQEQRPDQQLQADVVVQVTAAEAGQARLTLSYLVPIACWRPQHTARLLRDPEEGESVSFTTDACLWQNTGEDWCGVQLQLSTQRLSLGLEPPLLGEEVLQARERPQQVTVHTREQQVQTTGAGAGQQVADRLPGIDDGGTELTLQSRERVTIPSDGRPHRVPIGSFVSPAETGLVLLAELQPAVISRVRLTNRGPMPVLAGPVDLIADHGLVGRTSVGFVAPDERMDLGFGPDPLLRVRRTIEQVEHDTGALSRSERTSTTVTLKLTNLGTTAKEMEVTERIPVSEVEQVRVELDEQGTSHGAQTEGNGFVRWRLELAPGARECRFLRYSISRQKAVVGT